ncbi:MAG TPA: MmcQ/YjbR family DNA-binding protein [Pseudonocardiaceae bacterium]|nr:MmcQ/YjbR family DNA-binding protein [Pseudonocardiaceae bacterium]
MGHALVSREWDSGTDVRVRFSDARGQRPNPVPTLLLPHCPSNAADGGDSALVDDFRAADHLGEPVTVAEHMLRAGEPVVTAGAPDHLVAAALLPDVGHLTGPISGNELTAGTDNHHDESGANWLTRWFESTSHPRRRGGRAPLGRPGERPGDADTDVRRPRSTARPVDRSVGGLSDQAIMLAAMKPKELSDHALALPEVSEEEPFGPGVLVYKVAGKVFAILHPEDDARPRVTLKCDPSLALELRAQFPAVTAGYHTNKRHWNTVLLDGSVPTEEMRDMVEHSYDRVVDGMPKYVRVRLAEQR